MKNRLKKSMSALILMPIFMILLILSPIILFIKPDFMATITPANKCPLIGCKCDRYKEQVGEMCCLGCPYAEEPLIPKVPNETSHTEII